MTNEAFRAATEQHINLLRQSYRVELNSIARRIAEAQLRLATNAVSTHLGHNLAGQCTELTKIAGQIEMLETVLRSL
jgi:ABC-type uncharacterized transport system ATPase component